MAVADVLRARGHRVLFVGEGPGGRTGDITNKGVISIVENYTPTDAEDTDGTGPFMATPDEQLVGRLDEHPFLSDEDEDEEINN